MDDRYTLVLRECLGDGQAHVAQFIGKAFSLKDSTSATIAGSAPIALLSDLTREEAAILQMLMSGLHHDGVLIEWTTVETDDLPKIDWPRKPPIFKRELSEYETDFAGLAIGCPDCKRAHSLLELLLKRLAPGEISVVPAVIEEPDIEPVVIAPTKTTTSVHTPQVGAPPVVGATTASRPSVGSKEFRGASLPEITPFSTPVLSPGGGQSGARKATAPPPPPPSKAPISDDDTMNRLNELFPDDGGAFMPDNNDISNMLDKLLPDEEASGAQPSTSSSRISAVPSSGFSVFLAKINDPSRREKAVEIIAQLAGISKEEAEGLSKKVIIPVLKGSTKEEAEAAKQAFAKIGILARIKGAGER